MNETYPIAVFNGPVVTTTGLYRVSNISVEDAKELLRNNPVISAVGHKASAEIISEVLDADVPMNRIQFSQQKGQKAIIFKLNTRPPEGVILNRAEIEAIGFTFRLMERIE